jgi:hypothetical protein
MDLDVWHVYPEDGRPHETAGTQCWCKPCFQRPCSQCQDGQCWLCKDGWVPVDALIPGEPGLVIHHLIRPGEPIACTCDKGR